MALAVAACGSNETVLDPDVVFPAPGRGEGFQLRTQVEVPANDEVWQCRVGRLPGEGLLDIARVRSMQNFPVHHTDVTVLFSSSTSVIEPGVYDCAKLYADHPDLMDQPILYGAQAMETEVRLPKGVVASVPGGLPMMHEIHYVNTSDRPRQIWARINAYFATEPPTQSIWGTTLRDRHLTIPPRADHTEWTRCVFDRDVEVLFLSMHTHQLGKSTEVRAFRNGAVGDLLYRNDDWTNPLILSFSQTPLKVRSGDGFEMKCNFRNPSDRTVHWGARSEDEMCHFSYVFVPGESSIVCRAVESSDGVLE